LEVLDAGEKHGGAERIGPDSIHQFSLGLVESYPRI